MKFRSVLLLVLFTALYVEPTFALTYTSRDLGTLGGQYSEACDINNAGQIVGWATIANGSQCACIWTGGSVIRLADIGSANGINDLGQVVGGCSVGSTGRAFVWDVSSGLTTLDILLGYTYSSAEAINNHGQVVGECYTTNGAYAAFIWDSANGMQSIGGMGGNFTRAFGINDAGQVVGEATDSAGKYHAFLWDATNGMRDLATLGSYPTIATAISNTGYIAGSSMMADGRHKAVRWDASLSISNLGSLLASSLAWDVNNAGQVVGDYGYGADHAFVWDASRGMTQLLPLGGTFSDALAISDAGWVVGASTGSKGEWRRAVLWTPVPEPSGLLGLGSGVLALAGILRRTKQTHQRS